MRNLNGWQRMWVVGVLIYATAVFVLVVQHWPTYRSVSMTNSCSEMWLGSRNNGRAAEGLPRLSKAECEAELARVRSPAGLRAKRIETVLGAVALWLIGGVIAYGIGWLIAWVRRGFRSGSDAVTRQL